MAIEEKKVAIKTTRKCKGLLSVALLMLLILSHASPQANEQDPEVLLILRERMVSSDKQMISNEVIVMKSMLEEAGFKIVIASASVPTFVHGDITLESNLRLADVKVSDYVGFVFPCMCLGTWTVKPEEVAIAKQAVATGKPVAAQRKGVVILSNAGVLEGKRHAYNTGQGIYIEEGVVQDGNIITSAYCPHHGSRDQTVELIKTFIAALQE